MASAAARAWRHPRSDKASSARPRNRSGSCQSTWPWRSKTSSVMAGRCSGGDGAGPGGDGLADLGSGIFLQEMAAANRYLVLVRPAPTEFALGADEDRAGIGIDEEFRDLRCGEPAGIVVDECRDRGRLAVDRDLARPGEGRPTVLTP